MKNYCFFISITTLFIAMPLFVKSQHGFVSVGGETESSNGALIQSAGQVVSSYASGSSGQINEGILQTFILNPVFSDDLWTADVNVYPNPTTEDIFINIDDHQGGKVRVELFDFKGKKIYSKPIKTNLYRIAVADYEPATYLLRLVDQNNHVKTFKIIKNR